MTLPVTIRGDVDKRAVEQLDRCMVASAIAGALCADGHVGYSMPVGGVIGYGDHLSVTGAGFDLGCGNKCVRTDLLAHDIPVASIMDAIVEQVSFGVGRSNDEPVDHPVLDAIAEADFVPQRGLAELARTQLGTVGAGNHYVDLFEDEDGWLWVGVHFGSRGFGHKTASGFLAMAQNGRFGDKAPSEDPDGAPVLLVDTSDIGQAYLAALNLACDYATAGRDVVVARVLEILGARAIEDVQNHHNAIWRQDVHGQSAWVVRKGSTPAAPGQKGFVGATMGENSVILEGVEAPASSALLYSTVHGAGRAMSRTQAAGRARKRWTCNDRDCDWVQPQGTHKPEQCPSCDNPRLSKRMVQLSEGKIDWRASCEDLREKGIELRGGAADEAPGAYKRLAEVLDAHADTVRILHTLRPIGVAMAASDTRDPYKD